MSEGDKKEVPAPVLMDEAAVKKLDEKKAKAAKKEGGKKGQDVAGMGDLGGVKFFAVTIESCEGDTDLLKLCMDGMNTEVDEAAEDRKGGAGQLAKMLLSAGDKQLVILCHVPPPLQAQLSARDWLTEALKVVGSPDPQVILPDGDESILLATVAADKDKERFPLKDRDHVINASFAFLRTKKLVLDDDSDDDVDYEAMQEAAGIEW